MSTDIELAHAAAMPAPQGGAMPTALEWQALERMATMLADSDLVPYRLKRKPGDIAVVLLAAREYGIPPLMALSKLPVVNGTPAPMGELMIALVLRAGHRINAKTYNEDGTERKGAAAREPFTLGTYGECVSRRRDDDTDDVLTFSLAEAVDAGLVELRDGKPWARKQKEGKPEETLPWELYTTNMLKWRAVANACRLRFPDVLLGLSYLPEELGAMVDAEGRPVINGEVVDSPAAPRRPAAPPSIEARTAADTVEKALRNSDPEVLEKVRAWCVNNGIAGQPVTLGEELRNQLDLGLDQPITLDEVLAATIDHVTAGKGAVIIETDATAAPDPEPEPPTPAPPAGTPAPETPQETQPDQPAQPDPAEGQQTPPTLSPEEASAICGRVTNAALEETDIEVLRATYRTASEAGLLEVDVAAALTDTDRERLPGIEHEAVVSLGALLMAAGRHITEQGTRVRWVEPDPTAAP